MKFIIAVLVLALAVAVNGFYLPSMLSYSAAVPAVTSSVWPAYGGLYGKSAVLGGYAGSPGTYGSWPVYGKTWGYQAAPVVTKVVDNGAWNYGELSSGEMMKYEARIRKSRVVLGGNNAIQHQDAGGFLHTHTHP
ncbi:hypothetical protein pipiens_004437 [Culex pipiens pipiens]|uniref:Uncharacterized protein n=1 Tax=Culex pipiens pipiens TaxID=38569 RepID=A0ABD1CIU5_CULPP